MSPASVFAYSVLGMSSFCGMKCFQKQKQGEISNRPAFDRHVFVEMALTLTLAIAVDIYLHVRDRRAFSDLEVVIESPYEFLKQHVVL